MRRKRWIAHSVLFLFFFPRIVSRFERIYHGGREKKRLLEFRSVFMLFY